MLDVDFLGMVYGFWAALPHLKESRGTFLHVSSALAYRGIPLQAAYCASKAAGRTFLDSARVELQKHGVPVGGRGGRCCRGSGARAISLDWVTNPVGNPHR